jgi:hemolysin activation/secretion protein
MASAVVPAIWPGNMRRGALLGAGMAALMCGSGAAAQVLERNLPPVPELRDQAQIAPLEPGGLLTPDADDRPIGPALKALVVLAPASEVLVDAAPGVDTQQVTRLDNPSARALLEPYLGRTISRRLMSDLQIAITRYYRAQGFPFLSVSIPEQEITKGVLQIRVIEFTAGEINVTGNPRPSAGYIAARIRQRPDDPIDVRLLAEDLNWLGRNPFGSIETLFSPGEGLGRTNVTLVANTSKPWRSYAGITNSGSASTGWSRLFAGFEIAPFAAAPDLRMAYQFTGSDDLLDGRPAAYRSHAAVLNLGIAPRQAIDLTLANIRTRQANGPFDIIQQTSEAVLGWRTAIAGLADLELGVEARRSKRTVAFGEFVLSSAQVDVLQLYASVEKVATDQLGTSYMSVTAHASPGGIGDRNASGAFALYTSGRVADSRYGYIEANYARTTQLGKARLDTELIGRIATGPLPDSEQFGIGAPGYVRGYSLDDGGYDNAAVLRNTLYAPAWTLPLQQSMQPYLFFDAGYARQREMTPVSLGAGAQYQIGRAFSGSFFASRALTSAPRTTAGDWRVLFSAKVSY